MRASFLFGEVATGLRRNLTMTVAMVLTTAISLGLLGGGMLVMRLIGQMQELYYDKIEVAVYLTEDISNNDKACEQDPCAQLRTDLTKTAGVESVVYESRDEAYQRFQQIFAGQPDLVDLARPEALPASFRVQLKNPEEFDVITQNFQDRPGVKRVADQGAFLERLFGLLNGLRNATFVVALVQAFAALLLISNTIQVSAYTRRQQVGIMRLVGASRWYTQLPFLLEAVVAGVVGAGLAVGGLLLAKVAFLDRALRAPIQSGIIPPVSYSDIAFIAPILLVVGAGVATVTAYTTLRFYVRL